MTETTVTPDAKAGGDNGGLRLLDSVLKALVALPLLGWAVFGCLEASRDGHFEIANLLLGSIIVLAIVGYCFWSIAAVIRGRRRPGYTAIWGLAVFVLWFIAIPGFLDLLGKSRARRNDNHLELQKEELAKRSPNQVRQSSPARSSKAR